jgi:rubredoxin
MTDYKLFVCVQCGFEYDEAKGWPEDGIAPGTRWDDIPDDWSCPDCGAAKSDLRWWRSPVRDGGLGERSDG